MTDKIKLICYSCKNIFNPWGNRQSSTNSVNFCKRCFKRYFIRKSGTKIGGMDWIRTIVRIRDNHTCQKCGKKWRFGKRKFDIHHLYECGKKSRSYDRLKDINNLTTLCHKCHLNLIEVIKKMSNKSSPRPLKQRLYQERWLQINKPWLK